MHKFFFYFIEQILDIDNGVGCTLVGLCVLAQIVCLIFGMTFMLFHVNALTPLSYITILLSQGKSGTPGRPKQQHKVKVLHPNSRKAAKVTGKCMRKQRIQR